MNVMLRSFILTVLMVALGAHSALALYAPHDATNGISCANCHYAGASINSVGFTNVCHTCHKPGGMAQLQPFSPVDASNLFNNVTSKRVGTLMNTSHNWAGGLVVPKAGAVAPTNVLLNYAPLVGLSCERCHNIHNTRESATNSAPFLRMLNDSDQMCLDCHSPRNTKNQTTGSHPVTMTYTTAIKKFSNYSTRFYKTPVNANPSNSTSAMNLTKGGQLLCSTCHGIHNTDSNSTTFDSHSSSLLGRLKPSTGYLLRTDLRGATANAVNICTNCHRGYVAHNGKGQNVQCSDCHSAHVDEADGTKPNVWLVQRYMAYSTALTGKVDNRNLLIPTFFQSTTVKNYRDANGTGVCQSCHALPTTVTEHSQPNVNCNLCHTHAANTFSAGSCLSCHGQPPATNTPGGPTGYAGTYGTTTGVSEALTPHVSHATTVGYACAECHNGNVHQSGNFQQVYLSTAGFLAAKNGATPVYSTSARTCATTYCHSNGVVAGRVSGTPVYTTAVWVAGKGTIIGTATECIACHGGAGSSAKPMATGTHTAHITNYSFGCKECHINTTTNGTSLVAGGAHLNGTSYVSGTDVKFDPAGKNSAGLYNATVGNLGCSATYCHSNGRGGAPKQVAQWGTTLSTDCAGCHGGNATLAAFKVISSGKHLSHIKNAPAGGKFGCVDCHALTVTADTTLVAGKANHVNGVIDYSGANAGTIVSGVCSTSYCHSNGQSAPVYKTTAAWTSATNYGCTSCHGSDTNPPTGAGVFTSLFGEPNYNSYTTAGSIFRNSHQKHVAAASDCQTCHATTTRSGFSILSSSTTHIDKTRTVSFNPANVRVASATYNSALKTCSNVACHSNTTMKWGSKIGNCAACHPTLSGAHSAHIGTLLTNISFYNYTANKSSGSELVAGASYAFGCANCHPTDPNLHANGVVDVVLAPSVAGGTLKAKNSATAAVTVVTAGSNVTCFGVYCHSNGQATPTFATAPNWYGGAIAGDKCAACHGNSPTTGAHAAHVVGNHYDDVFNGVYGKYSSAAAVGKPAGHGDPAQSTTLSCNICHNTTISVAYNDKNAACATCHNGTRSALKGNAAITNRSMHVNGKADLSFWTGGNLKSKAQIRPASFANYTTSWTRTTYKSGAASVDTAKSVLSNSMYNGGNCSNVACHNGTTVNWTTDVGKAAQCVICHSKL
jgi:predicted CxxxxCH...CXXCH cytochrome family protein